MSHNKSLKNKSLKIIYRSFWLQIAILVFFWAIGEAFSKILHLPIPGSIIGLGIFLTLLFTKRFSAFVMKKASSWLLANMLLFFVPTVLAILDHPEFLGLIGLKIAFVIIASTVTTMFTTAMAVDFAYRLMTKEVKDVRVANTSL